MAIHRESANTMNNSLYDINEFSNDKVSHYNNTAFNLRKKLRIEDVRNEFHDDDIDKIFPIAVD